jgi:hypothetical protein
MIIKTCPLKPASVIFEAGPRGADKQTSLEEHFLALQPFKNSVMFAGLVTYDICPFDHLLLHTLPFSHQIVLLVPSLFLLLLLFSVLFLSSSLF